MPEKPTPGTPDPVDGAGEQPHPDAVQAAKLFARFLKFCSKLAGREYPVRFSPGGEGSVRLEWDDGVSRHQITIHPDGATSSAEVLPPDESIA